MHINLIEISKRIHASKATKSERHGFNRQRKARERKAQHTVQGTYAECKTADRHATYNKDSDGLTCQHEQETCKQHFTKPAGKRKSHPFVKNDFYCPSYHGKKERIKDYLSRHCSIYVITCDLEQMPACTVLEFHAQRVDEHDDYHHLQHCRNHHISKVSTIVHGGIAYLVHVDVYRAEKSHDLVFVHPLHAKHLTLHGTGCEVHHCKNILPGKRSAQEIQSVDIETEFWLAL